METLDTRNVVYSGPKMVVCVDQVVLKNGESASRDVIVAPETVVILPILDCNVLLVRQYRHPVLEELLEVPAGRVEGNEDIISRASIELQEEVGYKPGDLVKLAEVYASPGYSTEKMHVYAALDLQKSNLPCDEDEYIQVELLPYYKALVMAKSCRFKDAKTCLALLLAQDLMATVR